MKALFNDGLHKQGVDILEKENISVDTNKRDYEQLLEEIGNFDVLGVRSATKVTKEIIEKGAKGNLKIIGRAGIGYDNIDEEAANKNGLIIKIAPHGNTNQTAEIALALMANVSRNIGQSYLSLKKGIWMKKPFKGTELSHKTLGIIGCGRIGQRLSELVIGYDMDVIGCDQNLDYVKANFPESRIKYLPKEEVLKNSDYISIHTGGKSVIIGKEELQLMKPTAILVNASRGSNIDEDALYEALKNKKILGAGLDVHLNEPKENQPFESKFKDLENVVMTSHLGASTEEGQIRTSIEIATTIVDYLSEGDFTNAVNASEKVELEQKPCYPLFIYHKDAPGVFAQISQCLAKHRVNIRENPSRQIGNNGYANTVYLIHEKPNDKILKDLEKIDSIKRVRI